MQDEITRAVKWIQRSQREKMGGSSAYYSSFLNPYRKWASEYPETTGYIIPTLIRYGINYNDKSAIETAVSMTSWLLRLQNPDGSFQGGLAGQKKRFPSVFNTAQILFGLLALYEHTQKSEYLQAGIKAGKWIQNAQKKDGTWTRFSYVDGFSPSYYTRVAWPLLLLASVTDDDNLRKKAILGLSKIVERQKKNGVIREWGFRPDKAAFTHTIAYTVRGLIEAAILLNDFDGEFATAARKVVYKLFRLFEINGKLGGSYGENWEPDYSFSCLTGNCQIAICMMRMYEIDKDVRLLNAAAKLVSSVEKRQFLREGHENDGGVPGSWPIFGKYMFMRYPNWAAKFFVDSKLMLIYFLERLAQKNGIQAYTASQQAALKSYSVIEVC